MLQKDDLVRLFAPVLPLLQTFTATLFSKRSRPPSREKRESRHSDRDVKSCVRVFVNECALRTGVLLIVGQQKRGRPACSKVGRPIQFGRRTTFWHDILSFAEIGAVVFRPKCQKIE